MQQLRSDVPRTPAASRTTLVSACAVGSPRVTTRLGGCSNDKPVFDHGCPIAPITLFHGQRPYAFHHAVASQLEIERIEKIIVNPPGDNVDGFVAARGAYRDTTIDDTQSVAFHELRTQLVGEE